MNIPPRIQKTEEQVQKEYEIAHTSATKASNDLRAVYPKNPLLDRFPRLLFSKEVNTEDLDAWTDKATTLYKEYEAQEAQKPTALSKVKTPGGLLGVLIKGTGAIAAAARRLSNRADRGQAAASASADDILLIEKDK